MEEQTDTPPPEPLADAIYVAADYAGFVGAFASANSLAAALRPYDEIPFIFTRFSVDPDEDLRSVYVLPYRGNNAVALVTNSRARAIDVQAALCAVNLTFEDDVDYWEQEVGTVCESARQRFAEIPRTSEETSEEAEEADRRTIEEFLEYAARGAPEEPPKKINILESVIYITTDGAPST